MEDFNICKIYEYHKEYKNLKENIEKNIEEIICNDLLNKYITHNENKIFISHYEIKNKFTNITNITILSINIDSSQNINIKLKNNNKDNYDLTEKISSYIKENINTFDALNNLKILNEKIINIKKYFLEQNLSINEYATILFNYFYSNIIHFIKIKNKNKEELNFYKYLCKKYNFNEKNFEMDYLHYYLKNNMFLHENFSVFIPENIQNNEIIILSNEENLLKIKYKEKRYQNYLDSKYIVENINHLTNEKKDILITYELDNYFDTLINFIYLSINLINNKL